MTQIEFVIHTHIESGKATIGSLGSLYGIALMCDRPVDWPTVNRAVMDFLSPGDRKAGIKKLEAVKKRAWQLAEACAAAHPPASRGE